ncbi:MAG TPA: DUF4491 family protein [Anaerolineales bacterium]
MNLVGLAAAASAFLGIWLGHVSVRRIEFASRRLWLPAVGFLALGFILEALSLVVHALPASAALGIVGITLLWDALELKRQENRVRKGHAPANPNNPRHAAMNSAKGRRVEEGGLLY